MNTYLYVNGNPISNFDQFGLCVLNADVKKCLEIIFGESVSGIKIGKRLGFKYITTRKNKISLPIGYSCNQFQSSPFLLLHEFYHVLRQWNTGKLTVSKYIAEWTKNGSGNANKYERAANDFARNNETDLKNCLACGP